MTPRNARLEQAAERYERAAARHPRALLLVETWRRIFAVSGRLVDAVQPHVARGIDAATAELDRRGAERLAERRAERRTR